MSDISEATVSTNENSVSLIKIQRRLGFISIVVIILALINAYQYFGDTIISKMGIDNGAIVSQNRVLIVDIEKDPDEKSDFFQVKNALKNGGQICFDAEDYEGSLGKDYKAYGASDLNGYYYTRGAVLNYIASCGWTLLQSPSTGITTTYYFVK